MGSGITDADGHEVPVTVVVGKDGPAPRVGIRLSPPAGELRWSCTPQAARDLAASLVRAAEDAESAPGEEPETVAAGELRRGDVRDGERVMTVQSVRTDGSTAHVTWKSGAGRSWTQAYAVDTPVTLRRRLPGGR
ncbi:hypothetical protein [Streptomyces pratensis]|uniref:hypothetical protein n=1 Tax=Streptomyces pratensis TaxID=1169025 RepID=UPI0030198236